MGFQLFGVRDKWDGVWLESNVLNFEPHQNFVVFCYVYVFLLCKELVEIFVGTWIPMFCKWVNIFKLCVVNTVTMIIVGTNLAVHNMFDLSLINASMITSEHLMC
jgi:hypothetical protein